MRILLVHNYLRPPSGENTVFEQEKAMLRANGHQVMTYQRQNGAIANAGLAQKLLLLPYSIWSLKSYREISKMIRKFKPDVAHFHNTHLLISPSGYYACRRHAVPVVQTLHHFRLVCLGAMLFREGKICEDCAGLRCGPGIVHRCYRNSRLYSMGNALGLKLHYLLKTWQKAVGTYIVFSEFGAAKYIELGLSQGSFSIKPNFLAPGAQTEVSDEGYGLFIGRLGHEKGILYLLEALRKCPEIPFVVGGDGPLRQQTRDLIRQYRLKNTRYLGLLDYRDCQKHIQKASFVVFPSLWYEGMPMVILEAMAAAKPVIAADIGVLPEIIQDGHNGIIFKAGSSSQLAAKLKWLHSHTETAVQMGQASRKLFEKKYTARTNYQLLLSIYNNAILKDKACDEK